MLSLTISCPRPSVVLNRCLSLTACCPVQVARHHRPAVCPHPGVPAPAVGRHPALALPPHPVRGCPALRRSSSSLPPLPRFSVLGLLSVVLCWVMVSLYLGICVVSRTLLSLAKGAVTKVHFGFSSGSFFLSCETPCCIQCRPRHPSQSLHRCNKAWVLKLCS